MKKVLIGDSEKFEEGRGKTIFVAGKELAVFRYQGALGCIDNRCIHEHGNLGAGQLKERLVECPKHQWLWDFQSGVGELGDQVDAYKIWEENGHVFIDVDQMLPN